MQKEKDRPQIQDIDWDLHDKNVAARINKKEQPQNAHSTVEQGCPSCSANKPCAHPMDCPNITVKW